MNGLKQKISLWLILISLSITSLFAQSPERIFYSSFIPQDWDIYISRDAGKSFGQFTTHPSLEYDAVISPDAQWVVFTSERSGIPQLYVKAADGTQASRKLIQSNAFQDQATFSPDGKQLAFVSSHEGNADIYLLPFQPDTVLDISSAINLTHHDGGDFRPAFSPDGQNIAFSSDRDHPIAPHPRYPFARQRKGDIYVTDIRGKTLKRLTEADAWDGSPQWSADGSKICFYSGREGKNKIFEMKADGSNQMPLIEFEGPAVSPVYLSEDKMAFTSWQSQESFSLLQWDETSGEVSPLTDEGPDVMFNLSAHPAGILVFHGGKYPELYTEPGNFGMRGDVLAKIPDVVELGGKQANAYGVRKAFVAPPQQENTLLYYNAEDAKSFTDVLKPLGYSILILPLLIVGLFLAGIVFSIVNSKKLPFWKYLVFSLLTVVMGIIVGGIFIYIDAINPMSVNTIHVVMGLLAVFLVVVGLRFHRIKKQKKINGVPSYRISALYSILFFGLSLFSFICAVFINQFVVSDIHFYQVDYQSGERLPVFTLHKERNLNPANFSVIDSKVSQDGKGLVFTISSFRSGPRSQGDIWRYDFTSKKVQKLSESPYNDGFADISVDGKMVFRSGRSGSFDIYLKTEDSLLNLTHDRHRDNFPSISRQGDKIVFASDRLKRDDEYKTMDIFLMSLLEDNSWSVPVKISEGDGQNGHPHFSPDGEWVIYTTEAYGINDEQALIQPIIFSPQMYGEIVAYNIKSQEHHRLTNNKWEDGAPLWVEGLK